MNTANVDQEAAKAAEQEAWDKLVARIEAMPTDTGTQRAAKRLAQKRLKNAAIPSTPHTYTRQQKRANARAAQKALDKRNNEDIQGKNRKRGARAV